MIDEGSPTLRCPAPGCTKEISDGIYKKLKARGYISDARAQRLKELRNHGRRDFLKHILSNKEPALTAWAKTNAQACPFCFAVVQKGSGCNHITCTCSGEFCYVCGVAYPLPSTHRSHERNQLPQLNPQGLDVVCEPCAEEDVTLTAAPGAGSSSTSTVTARTAGTTQRPPQSAAEARLRIQEFSTLRCPSCSTGVCMDESFDSCFSLRCAACPTHFCAWCFRPSAEPEDPHTHVLDCTEAPEDMRGSALYLHDHNGGPHFTPNPYRKFEEHWRARHRRRAVALIESAEEDAFDKAALLAEVDTLLHK